MKKKILSLLMALSLMLTLASVALATSATEASDLQTRINDAEAGSTLTLTGNETITSTLTINKALTLYGAGYTLTFNGSGPAVTVSTNDAVVLKSLTVNATQSGGRGVLLSKNKPNFKLQGCTLNINNRGIGFSDDGTIAGAVVTLNNSTIQSSQKPSDQTYENWSNQADTRGIAFWNNKGITVNIENNSAILGFGYPMNFAGTITNGIRDMENSVINITDSKVWGWCALNIWSINTTFNIENSSLKGYVETTSEWNSFATIVLNDGIYGGLTQADMAANDRRNAFNIKGGSLSSTAVSTNENVFHILFRVDKEFLSEFNFERSADRDPVSLFCALPYSAFVASYAGMTEAALEAWAASHITGTDYVIYNNGLLAPGILVDKGATVMAADYSVPITLANGGYFGGQEQ